MGSGWESDDEGERFRRCHRPMTACGGRSQSRLKDRRGFHRWGKESSRSLLCITVIVIGTAECTECIKWVEVVVGWVSKLQLTFLKVLPRHPRTRTGQTVFFLEVVPIRFLVDVLQNLTSFYLRDWNIHQVEYSFPTSETEHTRNPDEKGNELLLKHSRAK